jgi:predicted TIM-barrel fold metal-dependent hydrolase
VIDTVGVDRVVFGTDYPGFAAGERGRSYDPRAWLLGLERLSPAEKEAILGGNLERLLPGMAVPADRGAGRAASARPRPAR